MSSTITNYDGSITTTPRKVVRPQTVQQLQAILRDKDQYPSPVRAMGSFHSLTPCAASDGTLVDMKGMKEIIGVDLGRMTFTAQAGLQVVEAARFLREQNLQLILNIEIGNLTLGSAACCQTKDALDGVELGQVNSYLVGVKWVAPSGDLEEASEASNAELLSLIRASYGLAGIVYETTFRIKPLEIIRFDYHIHKITDLTQDQVAQAIASNQGIVCWTVEDSVVIQTRNAATELEHEWLADLRQFGWNCLGAFSGRAVRQLAMTTPLTGLVEDVGFGIELGVYRLLSKVGGFTLHAPDKMIDYSRTPRIGRYAFTFWAFPRDQWVSTLKDFVTLRDDFSGRTRFKCNMPCGAYFIRKDRSSLLSYTYDGDTISLDPIHAASDVDKHLWSAFLVEFNDWAHRRGGIPLLNQSPFVTREHLVSAYGDRWRQLCEWVRSVDPTERMLNDFFRERLW